jgi:hypothetical protein
MRNAACRLPSLQGRGSHAQALYFLGSARRARLTARPSPSISRTIRYMARASPERTFDIRSSNTRSPANIAISLALFSIAFPTASSFRIRTLRSASKQVRSLRNPDLIVFFVWVCFELLIDTSGAPARLPHQKIAKCAAQARTIGDIFLTFGDTSRKD